MEKLKRARTWISNLPDKKRYFEFVTALLSIPVLLTVFYINYLSIQEKKTPQDKNSTTPTVVVVNSGNNNDDDNNDPAPTASPECIAEIGPVEIVSPEEDATIDNSPLEIDIDYDQGDYCSVVWSYRINNSSWSDYSDNDILIYNLSSGNKTFELRVKSIVSGKEKTLRRSFVYENEEDIPTPTAAPTQAPTTTPGI